MKYKVTIGRGNEFYDLEKDMFEEGEKVTFSFYFATDTDYHVASEQVKVTCEGAQPYGKLVYSFIMPACDVTVEVSSRNSMTALPTSKKSLKLPGKSRKDLVKALKENSDEYCPECGYHFSEPMKFCPECGHKMGWWQKRK